jgi:hypothetical protein
MPVSFVTTRKELAWLVHTQRRGTMPVSFVITRKELAWLVRQML